MSTVETYSNLWNDVSRGYPPFMKLMTDIPLDFDELTLSQQTTMSEETSKKRIWLLPPPTREVGPIHLQAPEGPCIPRISPSINTSSTGGLGTPRHRRWGPDGKPRIERVDFAKKQTKRDNSLGATVSDIGAMVISKMHEINTSEVTDGQDISMDQMECLNESRVKNPELTLEPSSNAQILQNPDWPNSDTNNTEETYSAYVSGVFVGEFAFYPLTSAIFVVAG